MRLFFAALVLCAANLSAQSGIPKDVYAPDQLEFRARGSVGYDSNVELEHRREKHSEYLQQLLRAGIGIELPFGRVFGFGNALGRVQLREPDASTWSVNVRAGWAFGTPGEMFFAGVDIGAGVERQIEYEIYGPPTGQEDMRHAEYDVRGWFDLSVSLLRLRLQSWAAIHDYSDDTSGRFWDLRSVPRVEPPFVLQTEPGSPDHSRVGGYGWIGVEPLEGVGAGPYIWVEHTSFRDQPTMSRAGVVTNDRLEYLRVEYGLSIYGRHEFFGISTDLYYRDQVSPNEDDEGVLDYTEYGWSLAAQVEIHPITAALGWTLWDREYKRLSTSAQPVPPFQQAPPASQLLEDYFDIHFEIMGKPATWATAGLRYKFTQRRSSMDELQYIRNEVEMVFEVEW